MNARILVRLTPENYEKTQQLAGALVDYFGERLDVSDCLEFTTTDPEVALAVGNLFNAHIQVDPVEDEFAAGWQRIMDMALTEPDPREAPATTEDLLIPEPEEVANYDPATITFEEAVAEHVLAPTPELPEEPTGVETTDPEPSKTLAAVLAAAEKALPLCVVCHEPFQPARKDSLHCGKPECKKAAYAMKARERKAKTNGNGNGHQPEAEKDEPGPAQTRKWLIEKPGGEQIEVDSIHHLLDRGKLEAGQRVHKKGGSWFQVEEQFGVLVLVSENGNGAKA